MIEELLMYSLAGLIVYITASMFMYKEEVKTIKQQLRYKEEQLEDLRERIKEVNNNNERERYRKIEIGRIE